MTKEEKAVVGAAIDYIAAEEANLQLYEKAALEQAVLCYLAKKAEEVRAAGHWPGEGVSWVGPLSGVVLAGVGRIGERVVTKAWEYYIWLPFDDGTFLRDLVELGQCGWELVLRQPDGTYIFKRPMLQCEEEEKQDESGS